MHLVDSIGSLRIGIHTPRSGALENAARKAHELGANCLQIFSSSPRMWRASILDPPDVLRMKALRREYDLYPLVIHVNYLVNLATLDPTIRERSILSFRGELDRAAQMEADYLVVHPGNYKGQTCELGIAAFVLGLAEAAEGFSSPKPTVLFENTVGSGCQIGSRPEELHMLRELALRETPLDIGYCLDTCHLLASGHDVSTESGLHKTVERVGRTIGLDLVKVIHANDSKGGLGSRLDRHQNIGQGYIGEDGFRRILRHPALRDKPFILETPVDEEGDDRKNLETLKRLSR